MHVFNATVRLDGNVSHEVVKYGLTVPEIHILNKLHGGTSGTGAVVKMQHVGIIPDFDDAEERERLEYEYDPGLAALHEDLKTSVKKMFSEYGPLPAVLKEYAGEYVDYEGELEEFRKSPVYQSPNALSAADERKLRKEERKKNKANAAAAEVKLQPTVKPKGAIPPKKSSAAALEAVM